jgi:hypothetical protein
VGDVVLRCEVVGGGSVNLKILTSASPVSGTDLLYAWFLLELIHSEIFTPARPGVRAKKKPEGDLLPVFF